MTKNILKIHVFEIEVKRLFFMTKDVINYKKNELHKSTIENIMILKKTCNMQKMNNMKTEISKTLINILVNEIFEDFINKKTKWLNENDERSDDERLNKSNLRQNLLSIFKTLFKNQSFSLLLRV
jgi:translation initiation factor IF-2